MIRHLPHAELAASVQTVSLKQKTNVNNNNNNATDGSTNGSVWHAAGVCSKSEQSGFKKNNKKKALASHAAS